MIENKGVEPTEEVASVEWREEEMGKEANLWLSAIQQGGHMSLDAAMMDRVRQSMTTVSLLFGLALLLGGGYFLERQREFIARSMAAEGRVIENERVRGRSSSRSSYRAIVRFTDHHGEPVLYHDGIAFNPPSFHVGESVTIFYDPQNPQKAMIDRGAKNYLIPGIAFGLGALITLSWLPRLFRRA